MPAPSAACGALSSNDSTSVWDQICSLIAKRIYDAQMSSAAEPATCDQEKFSLATTAAKLYMSSLCFLATALCAALVYQLLTYGMRREGELAVPDTKRSAPSGSSQSKGPALGPALEASTSDDSVMTNLPTSPDASSDDRFQTWPSDLPDMLSGRRGPRSRRIRQVTIQ